MSNYQIVQNISRKGDKVSKPVRVKKSINYLAIPFKDMKPGDCVVVKAKSDSSNAKACVKVGLKRALPLINLDPNDFLVDWTKDMQNVAVWRVK